MWKVDCNEYVILLHNLEYINPFCLRLQCLKKLTRKVMQRRLCESSLRWSYFKIPFRRDFFDVVRSNPLIRAIDSIQREERIIQKYVDQFRTERNAEPCF